MSQRYLFPALLWALVCVVGYVVYFNGSKPPEPDAEQVTFELVAENENEIPTTEDGRAIATVPWGHLPDVDRFVLTDHEGQEFDSAELHGTPYVVSFFFSSCPHFCRELNQQLEQSNKAVADQDVRFLTITVDPDVDTVPVLKKYADGFDAKAGRWSFLTGPKNALVAIGQGSFNVVVDRDTHTDDILLVDKWGRYRDRFKWSSAEDMKRFIQVVKDVSQETQPPMDGMVQTRNVMAGVDPPKLEAMAWLRDFHLEGPKAGEKIFSRGFSGQVWLAHFAIGADGASAEVSQRVHEALKDMPLAKSNLIPLLTISESKAVAVAAGQSPIQSVNGWASASKLTRVSAEYFGVPYDQADLASRVFVVDRWGGVRDSLEIEAGDFAAKLQAAVSEYSAEQQPGPPTFGTTQQ